MKRHSPRGNILPWAARGAQGVQRGGRGGSVGSVHLWEAWDTEALGTPILPLPALLWDTLNPQSPQELPWDAAGFPAQEPSRAH